MSHQMVGIVIDNLLTNELLRLRFAIDPFEMFADLSSRGVELTPDEIDALMRADARMWFWSPELLGDRMH